MLLFSLQEQRIKQWSVTLKLQDLPRQTNHRRISADFAGSVDSSAVFGYFNRRYIK